MLLSILSIAPHPTLLYILLCCTLPGLLVSVATAALCPPPKIIPAINSDIDQVTDSLRDAKRGAVTNVSGTFVVVSKFERKLIALKKKKKDANDAWKKKEAAVTKYTKIFEYSCYALIFLLTYNTHILTISDPLIDSSRKSSYWKSITFPASTYVQLIPGWFAKELEVYEGLGGSIGVMAICYTASKSVKRIVKTCSPWA
ncbi:hypothetical protein TL16_g03705 [Triparma laevis f. inornata]|uniref:Uncharacterized protein n=2 Tax=Triparma laevis TaxID=1534972 RepID=A0A9W7FJU8_9STRA|nr:hypothetical protein TL16_g03705 [Triparma laevis f. inornata]GMI13837.1 hypothetical protein TrLO_g941 [Triparma laevis f. longispina]